VIGLSDLPAALSASLVLGAAAGLDAYLTLLILAAAPLTGWGGFMPEELHAGFGSVLGIAIAGGFYMLEFAAERIRFAGVFWHVAQAVVRPVAAFLLALLTVEVAAPAWSPWPWAVAAGGIAFLVHTLKTGTSLMLWMSGAPPPSNLLLSVAEDVIAFGLVALALEAPHAGLILAGGATALLLFVTPSITRASAFAYYLAWSRTWGSLRAFRWTPEPSLPRRVKDAVGEVGRPLGQTFKGARCGLFQGPGAGAFRFGWLVSGPRSPFITFVRMRRARVTQLNLSEQWHLETEPLFLKMRVGGARPFSMIFPRSGPSGPVLEAEVDGEKTPPERNQPKERV
jgi:hypothetical protein